jgi:phosphatidylserine decarboxylase
MGALPLRNLSRLWGYMNNVELPVWFRPYGFRFYAYLFGCNLEEIDPDDLTAYTSLGDFFYRKLKDGARPVDSAILVRNPICLDTEIDSLSVIGQPS